MEVEFCAVEVDCVDESLGGSESVGLLFDRLDFVVQAFGGGVGDAELEVVEDAGKVAFDGAGGLDDGLELAFGGPFVPGVEEALGAGGVDVVPEALEVLFDGPGLGGFEVGLTQEGEVFTAELGQVLRVVEPSVAGAFEVVSAFGGELFVFLAADGVHGVAQVALDVKLVQDHLAVGGGDPLAASGGEGFPHVHGHAFDLAGQALGQALEEGLEGLAGAVAADPDDPRGVQVADDGDVVVALEHGLLVDADAAQPGEVALGQAPCDGAGHDAVGLVPREAQQAAGARNAHLCQGVNGQALKKQGEAGMPVGPRRRDGLHATFGTVHPGQRRGDQGLELACVQMTPGALPAVMNRALGCGTLRTGQARARRQAHPYRDRLGLGVEIHAFNAPRFLEPQQNSVEFCVAH